MIRGAAIIAVAVLAIAAASTSAAIATRIGFDPLPGTQLPLATPLRDQDGHVRSLGEWMEGRTAILAPVYFNCPNLCDLTLAGLAAALGDGRTPVLVFSIDPAETSQSLHDASRKLSSSVRNANVQSWRLLRADSHGIARITAAIGFRYFYDPHQRQFAHAAGFVVLDPDGRVASSFTGVRYEPSRVRSAVAAAGRGEMAFGQRLLLTCFDYDAATGTYSLRIVQLLRLVAVLAAAVLIGGIARALLRERWARRRERGAMK